MRKKGELRTFMASVRHASVRLVCVSARSKRILVQQQHGLLACDAHSSPMSCYAFDPQASSGRYHAVVIGCRCWQSGQV